MGDKMTKLDTTILSLDLTQIKSDRMLSCFTLYTRSCCPKVVVWLSLRHFRILIPCKQMFLS